MVTLLDLVRQFLAFVRGFLEALAEILPPEQPSIHSWRG